MATANQYSVALKEVAEALIRANGIKEGKWLLGFTFGFGGGNIGPTPETTKPAAIVQITDVILTRQPEGSEDLPYIVDAALLADIPNKN